MRRHGSVYMLQFHLLMVSMVPNNHKNYIIHAVHSLCTFFQKVLQTIGFLQTKLTMVNSW